MNCQVDISFEVCQRRFSCCPMSTSRIAWDFPLMGCISKSNMQSRAKIPMFRHIVRRTEEIRMVVNAAKTTKVCVSDTISYQAEAYMDTDHSRIGCQDSFIYLGVSFSYTPVLDLRVWTICKKFREHYWTLRNLKTNGFSCKELVRVYTTMIRPNADYACVMYHSSLTDQQDEDIDRLQNCT